MRSRNGRWNVRPAQQSRNSRPRRERYTFDELGDAFEVGYRAGQISGRQQALADLDAAQADDELMALVNQLGVSHETPAAGVTDVTPAQVFDSEHLVAEVERWLADGAP
jgi:hypothetical protein